MIGIIRARAQGGAVLAALLTLGASAVEVNAEPSKVKDRTKEPAATVQASTSLPAASKLPPATLARHIDRMLAIRLKAEKVDVAPRCADGEFLRRAYLDVTGKIPPLDKVAAFLDSTEPDKRSKLIDELLASKEYGKHLADVWQALLLPRNSDNRAFIRFYAHLTKWLEEQFNEDAGWDRTVRSLLTASGEVDRPGPAVYWLANATADKVTDNVTRMFLGVQLQCAQCHNHPFTDWKQTEYWGLAAFFLKVGPEGNPRRAARTGGPIKVSERPGRFVGRRGLPESAKILPPRFLQGEQPKVGPREPLRPVVAQWMTTPQNPFFAKAMVNRVWANFFGRGLVNPVDDMHEGNPASHPELLADLAQQFTAHDFNIKYLIRAICLSQAYQRTSKPNGNNQTAAPELYARMAIKVLTPEQLFDSLTGLMGAGGRPRDLLRGGAALRRRFANPRAAFVAFFGLEDGADPTEYAAGIPQVLRLMNSPEFNGASRLGPLMQKAKGEGEVVEKLYLAALARRPTTVEKERAGKFLARYKDQQRVGYAGLLWALVNCSEFALNK
jgi:hypothetical protein